MPKDEFVPLRIIFHMPDLNRYKTAIQFLRDPKGKFLVHLTCGATGQMVMGFLDKAEVKKLSDALKEELQVDLLRN